MKDIEYKAILEELVKRSDEGIYIVYKDGNCVFYNDTMASYEKMNVDDVLGKPFHTAFPEFSLSESTIFRALKKGEITESSPQTYKNLYGKEISTVNKTYPVRIGDEIVAAIEFSQDITEIRNMSETLQELRENTNADISAPPNKGIKHYTFDDLQGNVPAFREVMRRAKKAAGNDASVFIYGETGTGKELFAQSIHYESSRKSKPFIAQNCAAIPATLLEGLLFGTTKGSFTGAVNRAGLFEQANGGTLLLDEISAMPYDLQSKLLRVLQESYIRRIGDSKDIPIDVRIIATVNEDPLKLIEAGKLRKDLYYRLNVINLAITPLRERKDDIPILCDFFLDKFNRRFKRQIWMVSEAAIEKLKKYDYPGNVRELENIMEQAVSMAEGEHVLNEKDILISALEPKAKEPELEYNQEMPLDEYLEALERQIIKTSLIESGGNISKAAEKLMIKRQTLQHKLKKYKLL